MTLRRAAVLLHRYVGLGLAGFLIVVGLTGAAIAWNDQLERVFAPALFVLPPSLAPLPPLDSFALRDAAERAMPGFAVNGVDFTRSPDEPARFYVEARPGGPDPPADEIALDPSSGTVLGQRRQGDLGQGLINLMPFIYDLHESLALGQTGSLLLGLVALAWTADCFVGFYLTLPVRAAPRRHAGAWFMRWTKAWTIRRQTSPFRLVFDLHSAISLFLWFLLLILAWSSVSFNLPSVYRPVTWALLGSDVAPATRQAAEKSGPPLLDWRAAHSSARRAMQGAADRLGFQINAERLMFFDPAARSYAYRVHSSLDVGRFGNTQVVIDADDGQLVSFSRPTGTAAGTTLTTWIQDLHTAAVFGLPMRLLITATGLSVALLSVTGVLIFLRKSRARGDTRSLAGAGT